MAPHHKANSALPPEEREVASECRYMNQCTNVPAVDQIQTDHDIRVRFYYLLISRHPYNGAFLIQYNPSHRTLTRP